MPLPTPTLDDRKFQQIVDEAKRMITRFCPEWTDHNVSDPGVALIELFAWMTEMLLFRVNQVPDRMYIKFIEMLGKQLDPPHPGHVRVTFYLSKALVASDEDVIIWGDDQQSDEHEPTELATLRTDVSPPIVFTVEETLTMCAPVLLGAWTIRPPGLALPYNPTYLRSPGNNLALAAFPKEPQADDALYFQLERNHSYHILAITVKCKIAGQSTGVIREDPPWKWSVAHGGELWSDCTVLEDTTGGFTQDGTVVLDLPLMRSTTIKVTPIETADAFDQDSATAAAFPTSERRSCVALTE